MLDWFVMDTPWGFVGAKASAAGLVAVTLPGTQQWRVEAELRSKPASPCRVAEGTDSLGRMWSPGQPAVTPGARHLAALAEDLRRYFTGERVDLSRHPVDWGAHTQFGRAVRQAVMEIPYGETLTYQQVAHRVDRPQAARAVGQIMAKNPLALVVP